MKKSIKRLPKCTQEELTVLLDLVRKSIGNCQMVILFGSYARGNYVLWDTNIEFGVHTSYQSDYDILVVVTGPTKHVEEKTAIVLLINIMTCLLAAVMHSHNLL